ncbi:MAG TPA: polysaccharide pyruvyl transferase family protein [Pseudolabrys sp.]|nr:polysaccharide pyruvyl transferase family protein [Pseudolabrys sp.]
MKVIYYRSPNGNFGDDLNAVLWKKVLRPEVFEAGDAVLLGIGSIFRDDFLSAAATERKRVFVLGSGAGTGPLPSRWPNADWSILAVRGPLTAHVIGRPAAAVTDSAALLATAPTLLPAVLRRDGIVFMPHYNSVADSRWPQICSELGITFIDARGAVDETLDRIGRARLVITEAMHGAIVADTLRVPWIPVHCSPAVLPFKWLDWTQSLDLDFRPVALPPSSAWEALKHLKIRKVDGANGMHRLSDRDEDIVEDFFRRYGGATTEDLAPKRLIGGRQAGVLRKALSIFDRVFAERAADALLAASREQPTLSRDTVLAQRVDRLQTAVRTLERALLGTQH